MERTQIRMEITFVANEMVRLSGYPKQLVLEPYEREDGGCYYIPLTEIINVIRDISQYCEPITGPSMAILNKICMPLPTTTPANIPTTLFHPQLLPIQLQTILDAIHRYGGRCIPALDLGLGKTPVGANFAKYYADQNPKAHILFVCLAGKKQDFLRDMKRWGDLTCQEMKTKKTLVTGKYCVASFEIAATNPSILQTRWDTIVVDEAHHLKNDCKTTKRLIPILHQTPHILLLTGTPQENKPSELFNLLHILDPITFPSRIEYLQRYCNGQMNQWGQWEDHGVQHPFELHLLLQRYMVRAKKEDHLTSLPPKHRYLIELPMTQETDQKRMREMIRQYQTLGGMVGKTKNPREKAMRIRELQAMCGKLWILTGLLKPKYAIPWVLGNIQKYPTEKFIIWVIHLEVMEMVHQLLEEAGMSHVMVNGSTDMEKRDQLLAPLLDPNDPIRGAILTIGSCGTGLNLAPGPTREYFLEYERKPSLMVQAEDRCYRNGTIADVHCYWISLIGSHDQSVLKKLQEKNKLNALVVDGQEDIFLKYEAHAPSSAHVGGKKQSS